MRVLLGEKKTREKNAKVRERAAVQGAGGRGTGACQWQVVAVPGAVIAVPGAVVAVQGAC